MTPDSAGGSRAPDGPVSYGPAKLWLLPGYCSSCCRFQDKGAKTRKKET